jgi:hypothetical protein
MKSAICAGILISEKSPRCGSLRECHYALNIRAPRRKTDSAKKMSLSLRPCATSRTSVAVAAERARVWGCVISPGHNTVVAQRREPESRKAPKVAAVVVREASVPAVTIPAKPRDSKSAEIAKKGIRTAKDFAELMGALMSDILTGSVDPTEAQAICAAGDRLLKVADMQLRYNGSKQLLLGEPMKVEKDK